MYLDIFYDEEKDLGWVDAGLLSKEAGDSTDSIKHEFQDIKNTHNPSGPNEEMTSYADQ